MSAAQPPQPGGGVGVPPEHTAFEQLVSVLMSADNAARAAGEAQFAAAKASSPDGLCAGLLSVLTSSASTDSRASAKCAGSVDVRQVQPATHCRHVLTAPLVELESTATAPVKFASVPTGHGRHAVLA